MTESIPQEGRFTGNRLFIALVAFFLIVCLGILDYYTGWELGFFVFYFIPISLAAWYGNFGTAIFLSVISAIAWFTADFSLERHYTSPFFAVWNSFIRLLSFIIISFTVSKTKELLVKEKEISHDLRSALDQIKVLKGFLPICASCKKIRNDKGYWEQIEKYIGEHSYASFTHSLCEECSHKLYPELFENDSKTQ